MAALDAAWEAQRCAKAKDFFTLDDYEPGAPGNWYSRSQAGSDGRTLSNFIDVCAPYDVAKLLLDRNFMIETKRTLHRYRGGFTIGMAAPIPKWQRTRCDLTYTLL
jgi:hypothetical protein